MRKTLLFLFLSLFILAFKSGDEEKTTGLRKSLSDDSKATDVGNIGLTITNFGTYGNGFTSSLWPDYPSCEFTLGSGIEHIFDGGIWIGAATNDGIKVTTGAVDASSASRTGGFEFTNQPDDFITERSSLLDNTYFSPSAVSHQDFISDYSDTSQFFSNGERIVDHNPLGVAIHQESYAWNFPYANFFVLFNYTIKNVSGEDLDSVYVGLWTDTVVRNTNITGRPSGSNFYNKGGNGYKDSLYIAYEFDAAGDIGFTDSYVGIQFLGADADYDSVNFVSWQFRNTDDPNFFAPQNDPERYRKMEGYFGGSNRYGNGVNPASLKSASNRSILISAGPFESIASGDSLNVVFAIVTAKKFGGEDPSLDTENQKTNLYNNATWAIRAYRGEDRNGNNILDPGEDFDGDGKITRFLLPQPPASPKVKVVPESKKVTVYWDSAAETSVDPITGEQDFEGYRLYRTNAGFDLTEAQNIQDQLVKMAEYDVAGNDIGYDNGFDLVRLNEPKTFEGDETQYTYKYEITGLLNGWQYVYTVTAFDRGDENNELESLESSLLTNAERVIPGTTPVEDDNTPIGVYPNPYYGSAYWDGNSERLRKIYFYNLPAECEIYIYTLAGDIVKKIDHTGSSNGSDLRWFETFASSGDQKMSGGEHAWDLITDDDQAIASGLYLYTVKNKSTGDIKTGKFLVVK